jgi:hypothetical protein
MGLLRVAPARALVRTAFKISSSMIAKPNALCPK